MCTGLPVTTQSQYILDSEQLFLRNVQESQYHLVENCLSPDGRGTVYCGYTGNIEDKQRPDVDVNVCFEDVGTALHVAVQTCDIEMVRLLMLNGADPNVLDQNGVSAKQIAERGLKGLGEAKNVILEILESLNKGPEYYAGMRTRKIAMMRVKFNHTYCEFCNKWRSRSDLKSHEGPECVGTCGTLSY